MVRILQNVTRLKVKIKFTERFYLLEITKIVGIAVYLLLNIIAWVITPARDEASVYKIVVMSILESIAGYIAVSLLFVILPYYIKKKAFFNRLYFPILVVIICFVTVFWNTTTKIFISLYLDRKEMFPNFVLTNFYFIVPIIAFTVLYYTVDHWLSLKKQKEMTLLATNLANEAQLQMLRYQINPHFLFNALNTIRFMVEEDKTVARKMITELSNFFRYSLSHNGKVDTFENEINSIKNYLEIQKIRFEEKLIVEYDIDEKINQLKIPFFIILPLVENAIKFGLQTSKIPLTIRILACIDQDLVIKICNTGRIAENTNKNDSTNTGIENTKKRLALYFPDNYAFSLFEEDNWVISQITIKDFYNHTHLLI